MGHIEYSTPECLSLRDVVAFDHAGRSPAASAHWRAWASPTGSSFVKNNIDHHTGATFGCHENYLMKRSAQFTPQVLSALLSFLATRQIFTGAGRVGQANPLAFEFEHTATTRPVQFQISQRADHIVNDIYQWVQFNRAIINARDEPLADYRKYRRLHLLIGDSNMSEYATALKVGTTSLVLDLLEEGIVPKRVGLDGSRAGHARYFARPGLPLDRPSRKRPDAHRAGNPTFVPRPGQALSGRPWIPRNDWIIREWENVLDGLEQDPMSQVDKIDWVAKKWMLQTVHRAGATSVGMIRGCSRSISNITTSTRGADCISRWSSKAGSQPVVTPERIAFCIAESARQHPRPGPRHRRPSPARSTQQLHHQLGFHRRREQGPAHHEQSVSSLPIRGGPVALQRSRRSCRTRRPA